MTFALILCLATFALLAPWGGAVVRALLRHGIGKRIRSDGPASHQTKAGTATMGGLYFLAGITVVSAGLALAGYPRVLLPLAGMWLFGALGAFDDWRGLRDRAGVGWLARSKFPVQWGVALALGVLVTVALDEHALGWPLSNPAVELGWWTAPIVALLTVFGSNAVNITDGLDGLAGGLAALAYGALGLLAWLRGDVAIALFCLTAVGALLAFLWYNVHPARLFMGDVGSEALGAGLVVAAVVSGNLLLWFVICLPFITEALSVVLQVAYFKYTRRRYDEGRRILRMSPLHHHFELVGWAESQIVQRAWLVAALAASLAILLAIGGRP